jgi:phosphatidylglycerol lysyltransferase
LEFLRQRGGNDLAHLVLLDDKYLFYSSDGRAMIQYGRIGNRLVALGDPNGDETAFAAAIGEFRAFADEYDLVPLFYQVRETHLGHYHELGFSIFKLGEAARVSTAEFSLQGKRNESIRHAANRAKKAGAAVEILEHPLEETTWRTLTEISAQWLREKHVAEKGFSLGRFDRSYLEQAPIAVVRVGTQIVAFASLMPQYGEQSVLSIDLMRHVHDAPPGTMDLLFSELIAYAREHGYQEFDLGMAPLAGVGTSRYAKRQERVAQLAFEFGNRFYNYKGLRAFKEKYHPQWDNRYLAYPAGTPVARLLADTAALVAGGYRRIFFRGPSS